MGAQVKPTTGRSEGPWTILKLIRWTTDFLGSKGVDTPRLDAEVLLADLLGLGRVDLYLQFDRPLNPEELSGYRERVKRRGAREPVAYIVGHKEFYSLDLQVNSEVLIPRPETELLVDEALALIKARWPEHPDLCLADLGTGSGAVAIALANRIQGARILAVDIHGPALAVAAANARRHGVEDRVDFVQGDLLEPLQASGGLFQVVAANLPYVPSGAFVDMAPDVRDYEPHRSLDGGVDGLGLIERAVAGGRALLPDDGVMLLEIWPDHGPRLVELGRENGFDRVRLVKDLAGHNRIAVLDALGEGD